MSGNDTGARLVGAGIWAVGGRLTARLVDLATLLMLAVVLVPEDFGLVAMAMTLVLLIEAITDFPVREPILRVKAPVAGLYDTAFTLGLVRAALVGGSILALSWPVAQYFQEPRLVPLIAMLALSPMLRGCASPRMMDYVRAYNLRPDFLISVVSKLFAFAMVAIVALATRSYWAIAIGTITTPFVALVMSYYFAPYRPRISVVEWREFADIIGWNTLTQTISSLNFQLDRILLGRVLPASDFGRFSLASDLSGIPFQGVLFPLFPPLSAAFARAKIPAERQAAWDKALNAVINLMGPALLGMGLLALPLVTALLGSKWQEMAPYLTGLAIVAIPSVLSHALSPLALATYHLRLVTQRQLVDFLLKLPLMIVGIHWWGIWGVIAARGVSNLIAALYALSAAGRITGTGLAGQLWCLRRPFAGMIVFAVIAFSLVPDVSGPVEGLAARLLLLAHVTAVGCLALAGHLGTVFLIWRAEGRPDGIERILTRRLSRSRKADGDGPNVSP